MDTELSALIIGYQRLDGIQKNINLCLQNGIRNIYVSLDYPKNPDALSLKRHDNILQYLKMKLHDKNVNLSFRVAQKNVGPAVNVITSCDWFFHNCDFGVILEDDCVPNNSFFGFVRGSFIELKMNETVWLISGTQFVPRAIIASERVLIKYPQIWGWATSKAKWCVIRKIYFSEEKTLWPSDVDFPERAFWGAGETRAKMGYLDAWDIILAAEMLRQKKYALAANVNLVTNIGADDFSTHTKYASEWISFPTSDFLIEGCEISIDNQSSDWLKRNFYGIRFRHIFTTRITSILDKVMSFHRSATQLKYRLTPTFNYSSDSTDLL